MKIVIIVPCYNEEVILEKNINEVLSVVKNLPYNIKIVISDNNSKDKTSEIGKRLATQSTIIEYIFVGTVGKAAAVIDAWKKYDADIYGFMDADLAVDLSALKPALDCILGSCDGGQYDIVIGSRRINESKVNREFYRKISSAVLNFLIRTLLKTNIRDTACGFKFFRRAVIDKIIPHVKDRKWTFDTELLILAEKGGLKIKEIPVQWEEKEDRGSRVVPMPTIIGYLKKILELRKRIKKN